jgi:hypothetical protein
LTPRIYSILDFCNVRVYREILHFSLRDGVFCIKRERSKGFLKING